MVTEIELFWIYRYIGIVKGNKESKLVLNLIVILI
jgi:hypothetical protein